MIAWILTLSRLPLSAAFAVIMAIATGSGEKSLAELPASQFWLAVSVLIIAELTDMFDGMAARKFGTVSTLGGLADPLCDSLGRLCVYFTAALLGWINIAVPLVMAGRDIICAYARIVMALTGQKTSARISGKVKACVQAGGIFVILAALRWGDAIINCCNLSSGTITAIASGIIIAVTAYSGLDYCISAAQGYKKASSQ